MREVQLAMLRRFFKNAGIMAGTEIILRLKGFIFMPILTRHFGPLNYGVWSQVLMLISLFSPLLVLGTDSAVMRYFSGRPEEEQRKFFSAWNLFLLVITVPFCLILMLFKTPLSCFFFGSGGDYELFIPLAAASLFLNIFLNTARNWYRIQNNARVFSCISVAQAIAGIIAMLIMVFNKKGAYELVLYTIIGDLLIVGSLFILIACTGGWRKPDFSIIPLLLRFGLPLVPIAYAMWGLNSMDRLFLVKYTTMAELGIYSLVYYIGYLVIQVLVNPLWNMYPSSATELYIKNAHGELQRLFDYVCGAIVALTIPAITGLIVVGRPVITTLATPDFLSGAPLMAVITTGYLFLMLASFFETALGWIHRQYYVTLSMTGAFLVNLILNALLIPRYTIAGAAWATCAAFFFHLVISYGLARGYRLLKVNFAFPLSICALSGLMGLSVYGLSLLLPRDGFIPLIILPFAGILIYITLLLLFKVLSISMIRNALEKLFLKEKSLDDVGRS